MTQRSYKNQASNFRTDELVQSWDEYDQKWVNRTRPLGQRAVTQYAVRLESIIGIENVRVVSRQRHPEFFQGVNA
jgi:hypothetical protein